MLYKVPYHVLIASSPSVLAWPCVKVDGFIVMGKASIQGAAAEPAVTPLNVAAWDMSWSPGGDVVNGEWEMAVKAILPVEERHEATDDVKGLNIVSSSFPPLLFHLKQ